jgi:glycerol uptake facilitator-like aquaporin
MRAALTHHWPEYLMEAAGLGIFMLAACTFATLLEHPASPVRQAISDPILRRLLMGLAMGLTAINLIYSPWGKQSGAHLNPSVTLTFWRLGKVASWDALLYIAAQFVGGMTGVLLAAWVLVLAEWWVMCSLLTAGVALDGVGVMASVSPPLAQAPAAAAVLAPEDALPVDVRVTEDDTPMGNLFGAN